MKVFHLTYWYPSQQNPHEGIWIRRHIQALNSHVEGQFVYHLEISKCDRWHLSTSKREDNLSAFRFSGPIPWWLIEIFTFLFVAFILLVKARRYNVVNVHIAYPLLTYLHVLRKFIRGKLVITEHWSAYHFNFGVKGTLARVQRIFSKDLPLITVSKSLRLDIEKFSSRSFSKTAVIPNTIDTHIFTYREVNPPNEKVFFMLGNWKSPKRPEVVIEAFANLVKRTDRSKLQLRIGGTGPLLASMKKLVSSLNVTVNVSFLGEIPSSSVSGEMNTCSAFLHCSEYETFSVVCAEAVCCGTPVIASAVGGIPEFINEENGVLVKDHSVAGWLKVLESFEDHNYDRKQISKVARKRFSFQMVGQQYFNFLRSV